jgi:hypothetical protein
VMFVLASSYSADGRKEFKTEEKLPLGTNIAASSSTWDAMIELIACARSIMNELSEHSEAWPKTHYSQMLLRVIPG